MGKGQRGKPDIKAEAYVYGTDEATRLNNPEAGMIDYAPKVKEGKTDYCWDPRESPQLVWAGKAGLKKVEVDEQTSLEVPLVNLHIHERVSTEAILRSVRREDAQRSLFADPELEFKDEVKFYQHEVGWSNRMILGDSLLVMNSLVEREAMRGKVQCIYTDPPYGIKFGSNFQPRIDQRDVKDGKDEDLSREVMQVQAFRDTWELGVHSYLTYLRDRLLVARELLSESGSIFVQIGDENVHRVRCLMDEVFGEENFLGMITFKTGSGFSAKFLKTTSDYLVWYCKNAEEAKYRQVYSDKPVGEETYFDKALLSDGSVMPIEEAMAVDKAARPLTYRPIVSGAFSESTTFHFDFRSRSYYPGANRCWKTTRDGMARLTKANRLVGAERTLKFVTMFDDFAAQEISQVWEDTMELVGKAYAVQTAGKVIERCMLMTTDPGDLVLDPTCGSGTTAFVAEQWGRRWITCDTSRVALAIARHRLMTAAFDYYTLRHPTSGVSGGFKYKTVPHITLKSIAQNQEIDRIAEEYQPKIDAALAEVNKAFGMDWKEWEIPRSVAHGDPKEDNQ